MESLTRDAFWSWEKAHGCDEHYLAHLLRGRDSFVPELDFVAVHEDGRIIGNIMYTKGKIVAEDGSEHEMLLFGPISVLPEFQKMGIGAALIEHTKAIAKELGYRAIIIFGHPSYYPRLGFQEASVFHIQTDKGKNFPAFMALELYPGALDGIRGRFFYDPVYDDLPEENVRSFDATFPAKSRPTEAEMGT